MSYLLNAIYNATPSYLVSINVAAIIDHLKGNGLPLTRELLSEWAKELSLHIKRNLPSIFGLSPLEAKLLFDDVSIEFTTDESDFQKLVDSKCSFKLHYGPRFILAINKYSGESTYHMAFGEDQSFEGAGVVTNYLSFILGMIFKTALLSRSGSRMLTVERNSIYTFKTELTNNRVNTVDQVLISGDGNGEEIVKAMSSLYPEAVRKSLEVANNIVNIKKTESEYVSFAKEIEDELLGGSVMVGEDGDIQFEIANNDSGSRRATLPIKVASSTVKTLSGLVIYLKHLAKEGDVLIVDEPEMNLHPDNQRILARIFARMANRGIRLVISTHSDYIIREFNNLIMTHSLPEEDKNVYEELGYKESDLLNPVKFQVCFFDFNEIGTVDVMPVEVDEFGFEISSIDKTIDEQNEATFMLRDTLIANGKEEG